MPSPNQVLKFASRVELRSETGRKIREVHREEAQRLHRIGQAVHGNRGKFVRELILRDYNPEPVESVPGNSCRSTYREALVGGSLLKIETASTLAREVQTQPSLVYKLKTIPQSLRPLYETVVREAIKEHLGTDRID
jgi:hypothetical protein